MLTLEQVPPVARAFLAKCEGCKHGDGDGRCRFVSPTPDKVDFVLAALGSESNRPTSRNYAARIASNKHTLSPDSSWAETWTRLDEPCPQYVEQRHWH